jgi:hypothetical protein
MLSHTAELAMADNTFYMPAGCIIIEGLRRDSKHQSSYKHNALLAMAKRNIF